MSEPYTHFMHIAFASKEAREGRSAARRYVQVKKHKVTYCAQLVGSWTTPDGLDCWTVETLLPEIARFTVPCRQVLACDRETCLCQDVGGVGLDGACDGLNGPAETAEKKMTVPVTRHPSLKNDLFCSKNKQTKPQRDALLAQYFRKK